MGCRTCEENKIQVSGSPVLDDGTPEMHCDLACNVWNTKDENKKPPARQSTLTPVRDVSINRSTNFFKPSWPWLLLLLFQETGRV